VTSRFSTIRSNLEEASDVLGVPETVVGVMAGRGAHRVVSRSAVSAERARLVCLPILAEAADKTLRATSCVKIDFMEGRTDVRAASRGEPG
jgi:hypothetical protein